MRRRQYELPDSNPATRRQVHTRGVLDDPTRRVEHAVDLDTRPRLGSQIGARVIQRDACSTNISTPGASRHPDSRFRLRVQKRRSRVGVPCGSIRSGWGCAGEWLEGFGRNRVTLSVTPRAYSPLAKTMDTQIYRHFNGWRGTESNCRHRDFQSRALPTELPRRGAQSTAAPRASAQLEEAASGTVLPLLEGRSVLCIPPRRGARVKGRNRARSRCLVRHRSARPRCLG
jgi:hypothetical protein